MQAPLDLTAIERLGSVESNFFDALHQVLPPPKHSVSSNSFFHVAPDNISSDIEEAVIEAIHPLFAFLPDDAVRDEYIITAMRSIIMPGASQRPAYSSWHRDIRDDIIVSSILPTQDLTGEIPEWRQRLTRSGKHITSLLCQDDNEHPLKGISDKSLVKNGLIIGELNPFEVGLIRRHTCVHRSARNTTEAPIEKTSVDIQFFR